MEEMNEASFQQPRRRMKQAQKLAAASAQKRIHNPETERLYEDSSPESFTPVASSSGVMGINAPETETPQEWMTGTRFSSYLGDTPLVELTHMIPNLKRSDVRVFAKCEFFNPGFSIKDRIVANILDKAERDGRLRPGMIVVAASSGNTGAATAMMCAMRGYKCIITTSPKCSKEKMDAIKAYGATLWVSPSGVSEGDPRHYMEMARLKALENPELYFDMDQYETKDNPMGHYLTLGPEIMEQTRGYVTHFIAAGSTGGTISGTGAYLKEQNPNVRVILADPVGSIFTEYFRSGKLETPGNFLVEGVGKGSIPGAMNFGVVDDVIQVTDLEAFTMCHRLAREEGICAGGSSGLNVFAALKLASEMEEPAIITTVMPDLGVKYLSKVYNDEWLQANGFQVPLVPPRCATTASCSSSSSSCSGYNSGSEFSQASTSLCSSWGEESGVAAAPTTSCTSTAKEFEDIFVPKTLATQYAQDIDSTSYQELVGDTPLIDLTHLVSNKGHPDIRVFAKCEFFNPSFSIKDRIVQNILRKAEEEGLLKPGMTVVAASSGNTGASTAMMCAMRGYRCIITTSPKCSKEKMDAITAYGAELLVSPPGAREGEPTHYMEMARLLALENPELYFDMDQYETKSNPQGHYLTLGPEIYEQTSGRVTHFVAGGSTGGTISGTGQYLKEQNPNVKVVLGDPHGSIFTHFFNTGELCKPGKFLVEGIGKGNIPGAMDFGVIDQVIPVSDSEAFSMCHKLARKEGICAGGSAGLNVFAAFKLASELTEPATIVTVLPDLGVKYLSKVYNDEWLRENEIVINCDEQ